MRTYRDLIEEWGSLKQFSEDMECGYPAVANWKHRNSIPAYAFSRIVLMAPRRGLEGITLEFLHSLQRGDAPPAKRGRPKKKARADTRTAA